MAADDDIVVASQGAPCDARVLVGLGVCKAFVGTRCTAKDTRAYFKNRMRMYNDGSLMTSNSSSEIHNALTKTTLS